MSKLNLIKKLILTSSVVPIIASSAVLSSCTITADNENIICANLSAETGLPITEIYYIMPEISTPNEEYYFSMLAHHQNYVKNDNIINHIDYRITYKLNKEEYNHLMLICNNEIIKVFDNVSNSDFEFFNNIILNNEYVDIFKIVSDKDEHRKSLLSNNKYIKDENIENNQ